MQGLDAYNDSASETSNSSPTRKLMEQTTNGKSRQISDDGTLSVSPDRNTAVNLPKIRSSLPSSSSSVRSAVGSGSVQIIRKPNQARQHSPLPPQAGPSSAAASSHDEQASHSQEPEDELARIRGLLRPLHVPGTVDWGIPPLTSEQCDPELEAKLQQFFDLKRGNPPKHFNDSLMSNRTFRNPHLYTKLVEFVDVDEKCSNMPKGPWGMDDLDGWDAEKIASAQKARSEQQAAEQTAGKRSQIGFTSSSNSQVSARTTDKKDGKDSRKYNPYDRKGHGRKPRW